MRSYILFLFATLLFACNAPQNNTVETTKADATSKAVSLPVVKKDTTPEPTQPVRRGNYLIDTSRPETEINHQFPFDIDLKTAGGDIISSAEVLKNNGKPTILMFWLTTCYPCRIEMAAIEKEMPNWRKEADFNIVAISTDFEKNYPNFANMVNEKNWPWEAYNDVNREFRKVLPGELNGLPQTFIFDKDGNIVYHKRKYVSGDEQKLFAKVKELNSSR